MTEIHRVGDLETGEDMTFQRRWWTIERIGWVVMALLLLAALLGLLGPGPLSRATAGERGSALWAEYNQFDRAHSPTMLRIHVGPGSGSGGDLRLWINREYIESIQIEHIEPRPERVEAGADRFTYVFNRPDPGQPTAITYHIEPTQYGSLPIQIGLDSGPQLGFSQFLYP